MIYYKTILYSFSPYAQVKRLVTFIDQTVANTLLPFELDETKVSKMTFESIESQVSSSSAALNSEDEDENPHHHGVVITNPDDHTAIRLNARTRAYSMMLNPEISHPIPHHKALYLFAHKNQFRRNIFWLVTSSKFTYTVCAAIVISCSLMALDDPLDRDPNLRKILQMIDYFFTGKFNLRYYLTIKKTFGSTLILFVQNQ